MVCYFVHVHSVGYQFMFSRDVDTHVTWMLDRWRGHSNMYLKYINIKCIIIKVVNIQHDNKADHLKQ